MSDLLRMTGMFSGMDTEAVVSAMVSAKAQKVTTLKNDQTQLSWRQTLWQDLNTKVYGLYNKTLSEMRFSPAYQKKKTTSSDVTKATVVASESAVNGSQSLKINQLAKAGYLTGAKLSPKTSSSGEEAWASSDSITDLGSGLQASTITVTTGTGADRTETEITITSTMTFEGLATELSNAGVNATFDEANQRFFINSKKTGSENEFTIEASGADVLKQLGLDEKASYDNGSSCVRIEAQDAEIELNGAAFTSTTNTFSVNGLTINATGVTDAEIMITTATDYDGIYDMIKDFVSEYNDIINDVYAKYNAASARDYDMLTDEDREAMTDEQIETWENTIKDSLLRKDSTLYSLMNMMSGTMAGGFEVNGETKYLFDYGIGTLSYFEAAENERYAYHIDGDEDDEATSEESDKLRSAIAADPEGVAEFFTQLAKKLYTNLDTMMTRTEYRSVYKVYEDKRLQSEYDDYTTQIREAELELSDYEDKWYNKFSAMEVALSRLQSNQSVITNMLG